MPSVSNHYDGSMESLLTALAIQAGQTNNAEFSRGTLEYLADFDRETVLGMFGAIGHLAHYGAGSWVEGTEQWLMSLYAQLIATLRRASEHRDGVLRPGDLVEVVYARPGDHLWPGAEMIVLWVEEGGMVDVGFASLNDDYVVSTVESRSVRLRPVQAPRALSEP